jgi:hypothetical protein
MAKKPLSPSFLADYFQARGHKAIVLRKSDVAKLDPALNLALKEICVKIEMPEETPGPFLLLPWCRLRTIPLEDHVALQEVIEAYKDERRSRGYPIIAKACGCPGGCSLCEGTGQVEVLEEMSLDEGQAAIGKSPELEWWHA